MNVVEAVISTVRKVLGESDTAFNLHEPHFAGNEWQYLKECLDTGWVSSAGPYVEKFEKKICEITGSPHAVAVSNGTSALFLALYEIGVKPGDEVLVPALTFVATANAVSHCGAIPHFVDSEEAHFGISVEKLREYLSLSTEMRGGKCVNKKTGRPIVAIVPVHIFGHAARIDEILKLAEEFNLSVIEDAAEALGSNYKNRHLGTFAPIGVLSFNGNKIATTGGGGALLIQDDLMAARLRHLATTGKQPHQWAFFHDTVAFNFRMPNLNCALGFAQIEQLPVFLAQKRDLALRYAQAFEGIKGLEFVREGKDCRSNYWLNTLVLCADQAMQRDAILAAGQAAKLHFRPVWELMHTLPMYRECPRADLSVAESLRERIINLPSSAFLGKQNT